MKHKILTNPLEPQTLWHFWLINDLNDLLLNQLMYDLNFFLSILKSCKPDYVCLPSDHSQTGFEFSTRDELRVEWFIID